MVWHLHGTAVTNIYTRSTLEGSILYSDVVIKGRDGVSKHRVWIVFSTVCPGVDQRKHQSFASPAFVWGIRLWPVNPPHKGPVRRKRVSIWWRYNGLEMLASRLLPKMMMYEPLNLRHTFNPCGVEAGLLRQDICQYYGCWCPGSLCRQVINNNDIDDVG